MEGLSLTTLLQQDLFWPRARERDTSARKHLRERPQSHLHGGERVPFYEEVEFLLLLSSHHSRNDVSTLLGDAGRRRGLNLALEEQYQSANNLQNIGISCFCAERAGEDGEKLTITAPFITATRTSTAKSLMAKIASNLARGRGAAAAATGAERSLELTALAAARVRESGSISLMQCAEQTTRGLMAV